MSYGEYTACLAKQSESTVVEDAFHVAPIEQWELTDFADILQ